MPSSASPTTEIYPLSLPDALPISPQPAGRCASRRRRDASRGGRPARRARPRLGAQCRAVLRHRQDRCDRSPPADDADPHVVASFARSEEHTSELQSLRHLVCRLLLRRPPRSTLFPYPTLFRSRHSLLADAHRAGVAMLPAAVDPPGERGHGSARNAEPYYDIGRIDVTVHRLLTMPIRTSSLRSLDRKSTRLNSSHLGISYAVFCFADHRDLPSFPTRRSSDLATACWPMRIAQASRCFPRRSTRPASAATARRAMPSRTTTSAGSM